MSTRHSRTADKSTNDKHTRILKALLQKPDNKFCVDCRKKDPRWASFNLGCFMCIRCSGVHRSMGTHITKGTVNRKDQRLMAMSIMCLDPIIKRVISIVIVKSVDLDSWTVEQVENMIKWGNEKANMYWEARLPANSIPNENTSGIDPWIRAKYEHKQFARKGSFPDPSELGPIDEAMLTELYGKQDGYSRPQAQMNRSRDAPGSFSGTLAPPPSNPTRSSVPKKPATSSGLQGADLFSIGQQPTSVKASQASAPVDFFGLNDPTPTDNTPTQPPKPKVNTTTQNLFSVNNGSGTPSLPSNDTQVPASKPANADWKNSILSLYGNPSSSPKPSAGVNGFNTAPFGQLQGMDAFGMGNGNSFNSSNGFSAGHSNTGVSTGASNSVPQGGDFFSMIAGATKSPVASPPSSNKNNSAFNDLTWN
ncbi:hypothetical protein EDD11_004929 [Mortierella claussenii]|nr:hypothetical protein EDD11_004929 [Mortierella claussenii]